MSISKFGFSFLDEDHSDFIEQFDEKMLNKLSVTSGRYEKIQEELSIYSIDFIKRKKEKPSESLDDQFIALLSSYLIDPSLNLTDRNFHWEGVLYANRAEAVGVSEEEILSTCKRFHPEGSKSSALCLRGAQQGLELIKNKEVNQESRGFKRG